MGVNGRQFLYVIGAQAVVGVVTLVCATILAAMGSIDSQSVVVIFGTAIGLAGGIGGATAAVAASRPQPGTTHVPNGQPVTVTVEPNGGTGH